MKTKLVLLIASFLAVPALVSLAQTNDTTVTPQPADATATNSATITSTNGDDVADVVAFDDLELPNAVRQLALLANLNIQFDPRLWMSSARTGARRRRRKSRRNGSTSRPRRR